MPTAEAWEASLSSILSSPNAPGLDEPARQKELQRLKAAAPVGANWFFWIAGLSVVNSVLFHLGESGSFVLGLGASALLDQTVQAAPGGMRWLILSLEILLAGAFAAIGAAARRGMRWAFVVGLMAYGGDGFLMAVAGDMIAVVIHVFAAFGIYAGLAASDRVEILEALAPRPAAGT